MNWAWEQQLSPGSKLILMALADNADDQGYCWPKIKTIAAKCCVSERTARRTIKDLVDSCLLQISARFNAAGGQVSNGYTLTMSPPAKLSPTPSLTLEEGDSCDTPGVTQLCRGGPDTAMSPLEPPHEPKKESSAKSVGNLRFPKTLATQEKETISKMLTDVQSTYAQELLNTLANALDKGLIKTTPAQWFGGVLRRSKNRNPDSLQRRGASELNEKTYCQELIRIGLTADDAAVIAAKTAAIKHQQRC